MTLPVYLIYNSSFAGYSFSSVASQLSSTNYSSLFTLIANNLEYANMVLSFTLIKLNGCKIRVTNIQNENYANTLSAIPPVCFDVLTNGGLSNTAVYNSDTAMLYNPTNTTVISKNFPFQGTIVGTSGYPLGGNQLWMLANSYSSNNAFHIVTGKQIGRAHV